MDNLPAEIKRNIAFHLLSDDRDIQHIKQLRLVNKAYAILAAGPLFSEILLTLKSESFEHLQKVSAHPLYAKLVRSLRYEPKYAAEFRSYQSCLEHEHRVGIGRHLSRAMTDETYNQTEAHVHQILGPPYNILRAMFQERQKICQREHDRALFAEVMVRLPNLKQVMLDSEIRPEELQELAEGFLSEHEFRGADVLNGHDYGVTQLRAILLGAHDAGTKLRNLKCGIVHWSFFGLPEKEMERVRLALSHLTSLQVEIYVRDLEEAEATTCLPSLKNQMCQFFSGAKNLRSLDVDLDHCRVVKLKHFIGQHTWTFLSTMHLSYFYVDEDTLIRLLTRHADTLHDLTLCEIRLVQGDWASTLRRIRDAVKLKDFRASFALSSDNPGPNGEYWCINCHLDPSSWTIQEHMAQDQKLATAIREYVLFGGDCPLLDHVTYPPGRHDKYPSGQLV